MKIVGILLLIAGIAGLAIALPPARTAYNATAEANATVATLGAELKELREELFQTGLEFRGYNESMRALPDSVKKAELGRTIKTTKDYNAKLRSLEFRERETSRLIRRAETRKVETLSAARKRALPPSAAGIVALLVGTAFLVRSRRA